MLELAKNIVTVREPKDPSSLSFDIYGLGFGRAVGYIRVWARNEDEKIAWMSK